jgi:hypothetical protein
MLRVPSKKGEPKRRVKKGEGKKREVKFIGIVADAKLLGVSREHLYRVLIGQRTSQSLLKRYRELKGKGDQPSEKTSEKSTGSAQHHRSSPDLSAPIGSPHTGSYTDESSS